MNESVGSRSRAAWSAMCGDDPRKSPTGKHQRGLGSTPISTHTPPQYSKPRCIGRDLGPLAPVTLVCGLALIASQTAAQPRLEPTDPDAIAESRSQLWEAAIDPRRSTYRRLVAQAERQLQRRSVEAAQQAVVSLTEAIALLPNESAAYAMRGKAHLVLEHWADCAADLARPATATSPIGRTASSSESSNRDGPFVELGICQSRAGQLVEAERTLTQATASASRPQPWLRLGEVQIALGKLEAAIAALETGVSQPGAERLQSEWLLALAYDVAGNSSEAAIHAKQALKFGEPLHVLLAPPYPWLTAEDRDYALGLGYRARNMPEYALAQFRRAASEPVPIRWHRRSHQHIRELMAFTLPWAIERERSSEVTGVVDILTHDAAQQPETAPPVSHRNRHDDALAAASLLPRIRTAMPALRACTASQPTTVFRIAITRMSRRAANSGRDTSTDNPLHVGIHAAPVRESDALSIGLDAHPPLNADEDRVCRCLERSAQRIALPEPTEPDRWYRIGFVVVAP